MARTAIEELVAELPGSIGERLLSVGGYRTVSKGSYLFLRGDPADSFYLLEQGRVAIQRARSDGVVLTYVILGPGDGLGEQGLIAEGRTRTASALALDRIRALVIPFGDFTALRDVEPGVDRLLIEVLRRRVDRLSHQVVLASYGTVEERLIYALQVLLGVEEVFADGVELHATQTELASLAGLTRSTANRALGEMRDAGIIEISRGVIRVLDSAWLRARVLAAE